MAAEKTAGEGAAAWRRAAPVGLLALGALAFSNAITGHFVGMDAKWRVRDNPDIRSLWPLSRAMSLHLTGAAAVENGGTLVRRPVLSLSFALNHALFGPSASGFQAVNAGIHAAAALVLFGVVRRTVRRGFAPPRASVAIGFAVASIWLVHPLNTESVTYIAGRSESLMGLFSLLALYCALRSSEAPAGWRRRRWAAGAVGSCALGMATKEVMVVVPVLVWIYDAIFVAGGFGAALRRRPGFYAALAATWLVLAGLLAATAADASRNFQPGLIGRYALSQPRVLLHYARLAFWPDPLYQYAMPPRFWFEPQRDSWLVLACQTAAVGVAASGSLWAAVRLRPVGFLGACMLAPLLPTVVASSADVIAERRVYLPLAALVTLVVLAVYRLATRLACRESLQRLVPVACALLLVAVLAGLTLATRDRNRDYRSDLTVYAPEDLPKAVGLLTVFSLVQRNFAEASELLRGLLEIGVADHAPEDNPFYLDRPRVLNTLGVIAVFEGRREKGQDLFAQALAHNPAHAAAANNLAVMRFLSGNRDGARALLRSLLARGGAPAAAHYNYAVAMLAGGAAQEAEQHLQEARTIDPAFGAASSELAKIRAADRPLDSTRFSAVPAPFDPERGVDYMLMLAFSGPSPGGADGARVELPLAPGR